MVSSRPSSEPGWSGIATTSTPQSSGVLTVGPVHTQDQLRPCRDREGHLCWVEAVDRDPNASSPKGGSRRRQRRSRSARARTPGRSRRLPACEIAPPAE